MALLHTHAGEGELFSEILREVLWHGLLDTLKLLPILFLTYLLMEFIEHKASDKVSAFMKRAGSLGPLAGGALGALPQCGFSAAAANLYAARVVTVGTLVAVFLSTSDEMLPILISGGMSGGKIALILGYKTLCGILVGFAVDFALRLMKKGGEEINIDAICDEDNCHCERGIFYSALHHTLTISLFVLLVTLGLNALMFFADLSAIAEAVRGIPVISHLISAVVGLIPNCAVSVALTGLYTGGVIGAGTMIAGLFSGAGVGLLVLFRVNKSVKENLCIMAVLVFSGVVFGSLFDLIFSGVV